jgi:ribonucleoside-diphosphate reductase subunit M2
MAATMTPSKVAASALEKVSLSPAVEEPTNLLAKLKESAALEAGVKIDAKEVAKPKEVVKLSDAELRQRYVGQLDVEEKDEPILKESTDRFVLFPITYREVS